MDIILQILSCGTIHYAVQVVLTFESVDEILTCNHSNESYGAALVLSCSADGVFYKSVWMKKKEFNLTA